MEVLRKYAQWLEAMRHLLEQDHPFFPRAQIAELLDQSLDSSVVSWNWQDSDGSFGCEFNRPGPREQWTLDDVAERVAYEMQQRHPLVQWFKRSGDPRPMSVGRVPRTSAAPADFAELVEVLGPAGLEEQIAIPYRLGPTHHRAFVLARSEEDFPDCDVDLARRVQPLLAVLERQISVTQQRRTIRAAEAGLTGREVAVLVLLSDGATAQAIARRLGISPRTVHNHLRHIYRKLGVDDRMRAVLAAQAMGLIDDRRTSALQVAVANRGASADTEAELPAEVSSAASVGPQRLHWAFLTRSAEEAWPRNVDRFDPLGGTVIRRITPSEDALATTNAPPGSAW